jgi:hypothetical protein
LGRRYLSNRNFGPRSHLKMSPSYLLIAAKSRRSRRSWRRRLARPCRRTSPSDPPRSSRSLNLRLFFWGGSSQVGSLPLPLFQLLIRARQLVDGEDRHLLP